MMEGRETERGRKREEVRPSYVSPSSPSSFSVIVTVWLKTASWKMFPCQQEEEENTQRSVSPL